MTTLNSDFVRQQFPAFSEPTLRDIALFENAGGSYMCRQVMDRLETYFRQLKVQPFYPNPTSSKAGDWMNESYSALASWLNAEPDQIYFGPSTSQNTYVLANAAWGWLAPGDEIIVTNQDHEANIGAWRRLADRGVIVKEWSVQPDTGDLLIEGLKPLFTDKTKLLAFPHCSNILGAINPVAEICRLAKSHGVRTVVDGVSYAGHGLPDIQSLGADIYLFSLYKVYGPHQGVMVITPDMAELLSNQSHFFLNPVREKRLYPAGPDHAQVAAAKGVADYFDAIHSHHFQSANEATKAVEVRSLLHDAEVKLLEPLLDYFAQHPKIRIVGPTDAEKRAPTVSLSIHGQSAIDLAERLGEQGILCGAGHFYAYRLLQAMGIDPDQGVLRLSMVHYNTLDEVHKLIDKMDGLLQGSG